MPFFNNPNIGNLNNVPPLVEEEEEKPSTFLTSPPVEEPILRYLHHQESCLEQYESTHFEVFQTF